MGTRFLRAPIAACRIDQGLQNRRALVAMIIGRHCPRRPPHGLLILGCRIHVRLSSNNGLTPDIGFVPILLQKSVETGREP
jgi:hypothetical protein